MTVLENLTLGAFLRKGGRSERAQQLEPGLCDLPAAGRAVGAARAHAVRR